MSGLIGKVSRLTIGFFILLWVGCLCAVVQAAESLRLPISIKGFQLPADWRSTPYTDWQFLVFQNLHQHQHQYQSWQALTFQIDEKDAQGQVKTHAEHLAGRMQAQDELLLLWDELSPQAWSGFAAVKASKDWLELVVESPTLGKRYAYVYRHQRPIFAKPSTKDYVSFDASQHQVRSDFLQIEYAADDYTQVDSIRLRTQPSIKTGRDAYGPNILQGVHANFATGVLYKGLRVNLNDQQHIQAKWLGVKDGPLRVVLRLNLLIRYASMNLYDSSLMIHHYPNAVNLPSRFVGSSIKALHRFSWLLKQPEIRLRLTLQEVLGAQVVIEDGQQLFDARVDGQVTAVEKLLRRPPGRWLSVRANGWQVLLNNTLPPIQGGLLQQYLQGFSANFWYDEVASTLTVGADVQGLPKNAVQLLVLLAQLPPIPGDDLQQWLVHWIKLGQAGQLQALNKLHQSVWQSWLKKLKEQSASKQQKQAVLTPDQIAHWLMLDLQLTGFVGYDAIALQRLLATALRQSADWQRLDLLVFLQALQRISTEQGVDLQRVQYRPLDNTLWFAPMTADGGQTISLQQFADQVHPQWRIVVND